MARLRWTVEPPDMGGWAVAGVAKVSSRTSRRSGIEAFPDGLDVGSQCNIRPSRRMRTARRAVPFPVSKPS
ncbi:hypothetical protein GCM10008171_34320 [Methylopila jiangsuensis]|uniref:Uncharacterized protein n=1 Tax=Methylopila jiangsuensis TaxID=586230 RepID=A0A9W6N5B4_9HYPH|nr:hypothetical protein GCM10008171_34320 [Methylopila jiangsuensis]